MQMNLKYVLPEDKNEYISAGCWWGRSRLWWDKDEIILWWFVLRSIPVAWCPPVGTDLNWGLGGKRKVILLFFCQDFVEFCWKIKFVKASRVCDQVRGAAPAGALCCHAAATGYSEFPLLRDTRQEVAAVGWVSSFLYFSREIKIVHCIFNSFLPLSAGFDLCKDGE